MAEVIVELPDGSQKKFPAGIKFLDVVSSIDGNLSKNAVAVKVTGVVLCINGLSGILTLLLTVNEACGLLLSKTNP